MYDQINDPEFGPKMATWVFYKPNQLVCSFCIVLKINKMMRSKFSILWFSYLYNTMNWRLSRNLYNYESVQYLHSRFLTIVPGSYNGSKLLIFPTLILKQKTPPLFKKWGQKFITYALPRLTKLSNQLRLKIDALMLLSVHRYIHWLDLSRKLIGFKLLLIIITV